MNKSYKLLDCPPPRKACRSKSLAFTLAETLIALAVLGVIAAVIIPGVIKNFQKRTYVSQLQRWYADMSNTIDEFVVYNDNRMETFTSGVNHWNLNDTNFIKFLDSKYGDLYAGESNKNRTSTFSTISNNLWKDKSGTINYKNLQGEYGPGKYPDLSVYFYGAKVYKTKYGAQFGVTVESPGGYSGVYWKLVVDVNGSKKGPNIVGRDTFNFYIDANKKHLMPRVYANGYYTWSGWDSDASKYEKGCSMSSTSNLNGTICAKKIMEDGWKMDY